MTPFPSPPPPFFSQVGFLSSHGPYTKGEEIKIPEGDIGGKGSSTSSTTTILRYALFLPRFTTDERERERGLWTAMKLYLCFIFQERKKKEKKKKECSNHIRGAHIPK